MADTLLKLKTISAKGLKKVSRLRKMNVYTVAYISGTENQDQRQKTLVDKGGDSDPIWNDQMRFMVDESAVSQNRLTLVFQIIKEGTSRDEVLGEVQVPIKKLLEDYLNGGKSLQSVSYQVMMTPSAKPKGELSFSFKFRGGVVTAYPAGLIIPELVTPYINTAGIYNNKLHDQQSSSLYPPVDETPISAAPEYYSPPPAAAAYPPVGGYDAYYPSPAGAYPQPQSGYGGYQPQPEYYSPPPVAAYPPVGGHDAYYSPPAETYPQPQPAYGGYQPQSGYGYTPVQPPKEYYPPGGDHAYYSQPQSGYGGYQPEPVQQPKESYPLAGGDAYYPPPCCCQRWEQERSGYPAAPPRYRGQLPVKQPNKLGLGLEANWYYWAAVLGGVLVLGDIAAGACVDACGL